MTASGDDDGSPSWLRSLGASLLHRVGDSFDVGGISAITVLSAIGESDM